MFNAKGDTQALLINSLWDKTDTLTVDRAQELLHEVVAEAGEDFVYGDHYDPNKSRHWSTACLYVERNEQGQVEPGCIVARVMVKHGVTLDELSTREGSGASALFREQRYSPAATYLWEAQQIQDRRRTGVDNSWGAAMRVADHYRESLRKDEPPEAPAEDSEGA